MSNKYNPLQNYNPNVRRYHLGWNTKLRRPDVPKPETADPEKTAEAKEETTKNEEI